MVHGVRAHAHGWEEMARRRALLKVIFDISDSGLLIGRQCRATACSGRTLGSGQQRAAVTLAMAQHRHGHSHASVIFSACAHVMTVRYEARPVAGGAHCAPPGHGRGHGHGHNLHRARALN